MNSVRERLRHTVDFVGEVRNELRRSSWPTRRELLESTVVVITAVVLFSLFIGISDSVLMRVVGLLVR
jgi:preprotein translocase subunit SecE